MWMVIQRNNQSYSIKYYSQSACKQDVPFKNGQYKFVCIFSRQPFSSLSESGIECDASIHYYPSFTYSLYKSQISNCKIIKTIDYDISISIVDLLYSIYLLITNY